MTCFRSWSDPLPFVCRIWSVLPSCGQAMYSCDYWIPACAGMTRKRLHCVTICCYPGLTRSGKTGSQYPPCCLELQTIWFPESCRGCVKGDGFTQVPEQIRKARLLSPPNRSFAPRQRRFVAILFSKQALETGPVNHDRPGRVRRFL